MLSVEQKRKDVYYVLTEISEFTYHMQYETLWIYKFVQYVIAIQYIYICIWTMSEFWQL